MCLPIEITDDDDDDDSWGPEDDGSTVDGPQHVTADAVRHGVEYGRHGYGSIYVVASGNGGIVGDNCNYDGYASMVYTVTVGAVGEDGLMPDYGEECASMLAVTFSSSAYHRSIVSRFAAVSINSSSFYVFAFVFVCI